ncbi:aldehyde dehydrogenase family protein [Verrucomicrobiales bacterium]|jgi:hypothetical protein|nr:aldehyde dehydrogenase family protein [Verrucomicrobiales bacterium]
MLKIPSIPVLRSGEVYRSLEQQPINAIGTDQPAALMSMANSGLVKRDLNFVGKSRDVLKGIPAHDLMQMCIDAGDHFLKGTLPVGEEEYPQSPDDYVKSLSATSGLPHALIRMNMNKLYEIFTEMPTIIRGLTRGLDLAVLDKGYGEQHGVPVSYSANTDALAVVLPSNSPAVNALWMPSLVMKIPVLLKPGREEPWTPWRIMQSFIKAGMPKEAFSFYPTDHDGSGAIVRRSGRVMMFGDDSTVSQHALDPRVEVHGSGKSKIIFGEDCIDDWEKYLDIMVESVSANSGRSCINASAILVPRHADAIAEAIAKRLTEIKPLPFEDANAKLSGFANPKFAEYINGAVDAGLAEGGARDINEPHRGRERHEIFQNMHYLHPTIIRCESWEHSLANREFLFPFASVTEVAQADMLDSIGSSLVVTAITQDPVWVEELLECPHIERLNLGAWPTNRVKWDQPHEGNLFEFLYKRRSIHIAALAHV